MPASAVPGSRSPFAPQVVLPRVLFLSGLSSLMFQVVWQRLLTVYYGVGPTSITLIVTVFMIGLGLGSLVGGWYADRVKRPFRFYFLVEAALAMFGVASLPLLDWIGRQTAGAEISVSLAAMCLFLCIPTVLMGMVLPLVVKIFSTRTGDFFYSVSYLYSVNTLGAACGCLIASFVSISFFGLDRTVYFAAGIDLFLVVLIYLSLRNEAASGDRDTGGQTSSGAISESHLLGRLAYPLVVVTGFLAIGYEMVWLRFVQILVKSSAYTFSSTLAVYLTGLALGSYWMNRWCARHPQADKTGVFLLLQVFAGVAALATVCLYYYLSAHTGFAWLTGQSFSASELPVEVSSFGILLWPMFFVLPATIFIGAGLPLITYLAQSRLNTEGETVGTTYFFNTVGNVLGGLCTGLLLLPWLGTETTLLLICLTGIAMLAFVRAVSLDRKLSPVRRLAVVALLVAVSVAVFPRRGQLYALMHDSAIPRGERHLWNSWMEEGIDGVVVTQAKPPDSIRNFINGLPHGHRPEYKYYREAVEALTFAPRKERVLVVGFGTGSTVETALSMPAVRVVTLVEINRTLLKNLAKLPLFARMLADPKLEVVIEDGRRFLLRNADTYDVVMLDPLRSTESYSNNIYSRQFFEIVRAHLAENGVLLVWLDEFRVMPRTVASVFPFVRVYNYFCLAGNRPFIDDAGGRQALFSALGPKVRPFVESYPVKFLGDREWVMERSRGFPINEDLRPTCEYYLGLVRYYVGAEHR